MGLIRGNKTLFVLVGLWLTAVGVGATRLMLYAAAPGAAAVAPARWPAQCGLELASHRITVVMSLHPKCPCSRATLGELEQLLAQANDRLRVYALLVIPAGVPDGWERGAIWDTVSSMSGVTVIRDPDGAISNLFGAKTSGYACVFSADGKQLFSGGITPARGHMGDCVGGDALRAILHGQAPGRSTADVFGCPLESPARPDSVEGDKCDNLP